MTEDFFIYKIIFRRLFINKDMFEKFCCINNADLSRYSTIKIGGRARWLLFPKDEKEIQEVFSVAKQAGVKTFLLGNGSNTLFDVDFFDGAVISTKKLDNIEFLGNDEVYVGAGANLFYLNFKLKERGLSGMEWSYGIPASFGGLVYMNGGAFGKEIKDVLQSVRVFDGERIFELEAEKLNFSYRNSHLGNLAVLGGKLRLFERNPDDIFAEMTNCFDRRKNSQPYDMPSLGSVFKRILKDEIVYPAKLIDSLGLKGAKIGGVEVSKKHAGFIVNSGSGTAEDFARLVKLIESQVYEEFGEKLEREVIFLSEKG